MSDRSRNSGHDGGRDSRPEHKRGDGDNERLTGVLQMHPSGRGFVDIGEAYEDLVVDRGDVGAAMDGDTVEVEAWQGRTRRMARVVRIVSRGRTRLTGVLERTGEGKPQRLRPDDPRILQRVELEPEPGPEGSAKAGQAVLVLITRYPEAAGEPLGARLERVLGEPGLLLTEVDTCLAGRGVQTSFPPAAQEAAAAMPAWVRAEDKTDRLDLRDRHFVTIDPLNARDFDDAVAVEQGPEQTTRVLGRGGRREPLRPRGLGARRGGPQPGLQRLPARPGDPHAAAEALRGDLLAGAQPGPPGHGGAARRGGQRPDRGARLRRGGDPQPRAAGLPRGRRRPGRRLHRQARGLPRAQRPAAGPERRGHGPAPAQAAAGRPGPGPPRGPDRAGSGRPQPGASGGAEPAGHADQARLRPGGGADDRGQRGRGPGVLARRRADHLAHPPAAPGRGAGAARRLDGRLRRQGALRGAGRRARDGPSWSSSCSTTARRAR